MNPAPITLVVADDQATVREALVVMLDLAADVHVVAGAADGEAAVRAVEEHRPDVVLMDLNMPVLGGVGATERIRAAAPGTAVLVLTTFDDDESILAALQAGATGYLTKDADRATILNAVRTAAQGQTVLAPEVQRRLLTLATRSPRRARDEFGLTAREREILGLIGEGLRNAEIAAELVISEATVKTHINNLFAKAGFRNRADAVRYALNSR
ncbi:DNA-binding NarL/FixJ family response regulator [Amycolatopsis bartoniae]|uniref:DNA-binding response regulator n=1 Tax=Amycolatopsis bartoniae TaxID=941986 RepID=A0A8H9ME79_9PSEU|nr:response regulator transcription factor [Amycolatopsis bartoniae]MBB2938559.1 DNA-binding NarL/FixJ family response regulator [Amycolatopsis bartoniae]TVT10302.1 response regulator transcription factor [Amycolatopsis bartoniae]GHF70147.1 DNA-binding response regulator [Amycolatopsis bartoniae]